MKKLYSIIAAALIAAPVLAQNEVVLVGPEKYTTQEGNIMTIVPEIFEEDWDGEIYREITFHAPIIKNNGSKSVSVYADYEIKTMPHGSFQDCIGGTCTIKSSVGKYKSASATVAAGGEASTLMEWNCMSNKTFDYEPGTCTVEITLYVNNSKGNTYTVNYVYDRSEGIKTATTATAQKQIFTLDGRKTQAGQRGLFIQGGKKYIVR